MTPAPSVPAQPSLPRSTAGFHLSRELGRGGMGVVYEAQEISTGRTVALKVLLQELALSDEAMERFRREARLAAAISHAHCVFVYGAHSVEGAPAIAMELIGGETLEHKIRRGEPIPIETAVRWVIDMLDGLDAAHRAGVLHRDIKPSNCFVTDDGRVKVGDFGLSRSLERDIHLTQSGQFLGSPLYASPEQIRGRAFDVRSDLYSCGATFYAILTGKPPFSGGNVGEVLARILSEDPPEPRTIRPDIPRALEAVVMRAMDRDPEKRWHSLHEFREALEPFTSTRTDIAAPWRRIGAYVIDFFVSSAVYFFIISGLDVRMVDMQSPIGHLLGGVLTLAYYALFEGLLGWGPGKWLFGLRVVSNETREPALGRASLRVLVFLGPSFVVSAAIAGIYGNSASAGLFEVAISGISYVVMFVSARRRNGWRGLHDFGSHTHVIPVKPPFLRARLQAPPPEMALESGAGLPAQIADYAVEGVIGRTPQGVMIKARDATLERSVWIHAPEVAGVLADERRRALSRAGRLRWLDLVRLPAGDADVFESPGGSSLPVFSVQHGSLDWPNAQRLLLALVEELIEVDAQHREFALEQVWIDRNWGVRLLDQPVGRAPFTTYPPPELVREAARALFVGRHGDAPVLPLDLPFSAEPAVARLMGIEESFSTLGGIRDALTRLSAGAAVVQSRTRGAQLAINVMLPAVITCIIALFGMAIMFAARRIESIKPMVTELASGQMYERPVSTRGADAPKEEPEQGPELSTDQRRAREILIAATGNSTFGVVMLNSSETQRQAAIEAAREHQPEPSDADVTWADTMLRAENGWAARTWRHDPDPEETPEERHEAEHSPGGSAFPRDLAAIMVCVSVGLWGLFALPLALVFRGGLSFTLFGIRVRDRRGRHASRLRCLARCFLAWLPLALASYGVMVLTQNDQIVLALLIAVPVGIAYIAAITDAILHPARCVVDRVLRTRLVPR